MRTRIIGDSSCDILEMQDLEFVSVPLTISTDEKSFIDDKNIDVDAMLDYLASYRSRSFTSCPNIDEWLESFGDAD